MRSVLASKHRLAPLSAGPRGLQPTHTTRCVRPVHQQRPRGLACQALSPELKQLLARHGVTNEDVVSALDHHFEAHTVDDLQYLRRRDIDSLEDQVPLVQLNRLRAAIKGARQLSGGDGTWPSASAAPPAAASIPAAAAPPAAASVPAAAGASPAAAAPTPVAPPAGAASTASVASAKDTAASPAAAAQPVASASAAAVSSEAAAAVAEPAKIPDWFDENLGTLLRTIPISDRPSPAWALTFSPCGTYLAAGTQTGLVKIWNAYTGKEEAELKAHMIEVTSITWAPHGRSLVTTSHDCAMHHLMVPDRLVPGMASHNGDDDDDDAYAGAGLTMLPPVLSTEKDDKEHSEQYGSAISPDGRTLVSVSDDGVLRVWGLIRAGWALMDQDAVSGRAAHLSVALSQRPDPVHHPFFGRLLAAAGSTRGEVAVWDLSLPAADYGVEGLKVLHRLRAGGAGGQVFSVSMSADGAVLASGCEDGTISIYDMTLLAHPWEDMAAAHLLPRRNLSSSNAAVFSVALTPCGRGAMSASDDGSVRLWDVATGACQAALRTGGPVGALAVAVAPNGRLAASVDQAGDIRVWVLKRV